MDGFALGPEATLIGCLLVPMGCSVGLRDISLGSFSYPGVLLAATDSMCWYSGTHNGCVRGPFGISYVQGMPEKSLSGYVQRQCNLKAWVISVPTVLYCKKKHKSGYIK